MKVFALGLAVFMLAAACGEPVQTVSAEHEWCAITDASEASAVKFDLIFEAGLSLDLEMDDVNARASALNTDYLASGMTDDEAARAVSDDLFEMADFTIACELAFTTCKGRVDPDMAEEICPTETG